MGVEHPFEHLSVGHFRQYHSDFWNFVDHGVLVSCIMLCVVCVDVVCSFCLSVCCSPSTSSSCSFFTPCKGRADSESLDPIHY